MSRDPDLPWPAIGSWATWAAWGLSIIGSVYFFVPVGHAQAAQEEPLNPQRYSSPSGHYVLAVDPTQRFGEGSADYRLERDGSTVWAARLAFALRDAVVAEDGTAAGYSYSSGLQGGRGIDGDKGIGSLRLVILAPADGHIRLNEKIERRISMMMHAPPVPIVDGVLLDESGGRFIARIDGDKGGESWRVYRLSDGHSLGKVAVASLLPNPGKDAANFPSAVRMVPGTPLVLFQWRTYGGFRNNSDAHFALFDLDDHRLVWSTKFPADEAPAPGGSGQEEAKQQALDRLSHRKDRAILTTGPATAQASHFSLWSAAGHQQVPYGITRPVNGSKPVWRVTEEARTPLGLPPPDPAAEQPTPLLALPMGPDPVLRPTSFFQFPTGAPAPPAIRSVRPFTFDRDGHIGFLRAEAGRFAFVLVDPLHDGAVLREMDLDALDLKGGETHLAALETARWLLTVSGKSVADANKSRAWTLDAATGTIAPLPDFPGLSVVAISGAGDGRFVVLARDYGSNTISDSLLGFERDGRLLWSVPEEYGKLFSPQDVAVLSDDKTVAVVETIVNRVQLFDLANGKLRQSIDLKKTWGHEPRYPAEIASDQGGGFIVGDWQNLKAPYIRANANGKVRATLTPRYADGRSIDGGGMPMRADPAGHLWMSDRDSLLRLGADGRMDTVLGTPRESGRLGMIGAVAVSDDGQLYAVDARTGEVHVFDEAGRPLHIGHPARHDLPDEADTFNVAVAPDHHVFLGAGRFGLSGSAGYDAEPPPPTEFDIDGRRLGVRQWHLGSFCQGWRFSPDGKHLLVSAMTEVRLVDASGVESARAITRQFDHRWLYQLMPGIALAPDGTFAIASELQGGPGWVLNLYTDEGKAFRMVRPPLEMEAAFVAYNGQQFILRQNGTNRLLVFDANGRTPPRSHAVELPAGNVLDDSWEPFVVHGGRELWLVCGATKTVARFAWPP